MAIFENNASNIVNLAYNTSTIIDHQNGVWVVGTRGENILVGGFTPNTGILAQGNCGKTELLLDMYTKVCYRIPVAHSVFLETEGTLQQDRIDRGYSRLTGTDSELFVSGAHEMVDSSLFIDQWYNQMLKTKAERAKQKQSGKGMFTLPFIYSARYKDKTLAPLLLPIDSFTESASSDAETKIETKGVSDGSNQTYDMIVGNLKTRIQHGFAQFANMADMFVIMTAALEEFVDIIKCPAVLKLNTQHTLPLTRSLKV
jgi:hypothetical protein